MTATVDERLPDPETVGRIMREVARTAILPRFRNLAAGDISQKRHPRDLVTIADIEAERLLEQHLSTIRPGWAFVGEEAAEARPGILAALAGERPAWVLDPVDGTGNFAAGTACFAVIVALCIGGVTRAGFILDPVADALVWAVRGEGAWQQRDGRQQRAGIVPGRSLSAMTGSLTYGATQRLQAAMELQGRGTAPPGGRYGSVGREYIDLGTGKLDFAAYARLKPWDHAAGVLIHQEAGGFSALRSDGSPYRPQPFIVEDTLLLAPDEATWRQLHTLLR